MSERENGSGGAVGQAAAAAGAVALAGGITAVVLMVVGASLLIAGLAVLSGIAIAGVSLPFVAAGRRAGKVLGSRPHRKVIDVEATSREVRKDGRAPDPEKVKGVLDRLEAGEMSADQALDELE